MPIYITEKPPGKYLETLLSIALAFESCYHLT